jgi:GST-like protein
MGNPARNIAIAKMSSYVSSALTPMLLQRESDVKIRRETKIMITLYTWKTSNGRKASIMLEEIGLAYEVCPVDLKKREQFSPEYERISPYNKIPAIVDHEEKGAPRVIFETGAILVYLAEKSGKLLAGSGHRRDEALGWTFWASSGLAPLLGQWKFFSKEVKDKSALPVQHFIEEAVRLFDTLERRLTEQEYLAGDYSIADIAAFTRTRAALPAFRMASPEVLPETPAIDRWLAALEERPAVKRGLSIP